MPTLSSMGGAATVDDVTSHIRLRLSEAEREQLASAGIATIVAKRFRAPGRDGLPDAPAVDSKGTHMQLELLSASEFHYVIRSCLVGARRYKRRAEQYRDRCNELHGVFYDLADIEQEISEEGLIA
ncbi:hypothetical protein ACFQS1_14900 [Paractinoplanes rhizophilus]|jgi:hypothetical protein|uniref:Uncharacterized protein n=1 Tax=Paractinoplanes rhizophilus TaxID=1416877 RepID=A0ABW2HPY8_9ACTN